MLLLLLSGLVGNDTTRICDVLALRMGPFVSPSVSSHVDKSRGLINKFLDKVKPSYE